MIIKLPNLGVSHWDHNKNVVQQLILPARELEFTVTEFNEAGITGFILQEDGETGAVGAPVLVIRGMKEGPPRFEKVIQFKALPIILPPDLSDGIWVKHPEIDQLRSNPRTHTDIITSWRQPFSYQEEDVVNGTHGLRSPQIGALHAIHAHWIVSEDPATVVMPTGTGKTETMLSVLVSKQCTKVLVIVPTDALRSQIAGKFSSLGILKELGVIPGNHHYPIVGMLKSKPDSIAELDQIFEQSNVIVTTINIAGQMSSELQERMVHHCEYLFIDEAHHIGARTWKELKGKFKNRKILQFTATPFRNDNVTIDGKIIFKYPLKKALENGYFKKIHFKPVNEFDPEKVDTAIAEKAVAQLREDPINHILMARVETVARAEEVFRIYEQYREFNPVQIHSGIKSKKDRERVRQELLTGRSRIVVCVDMLGEGFDLPELKIAAFHDIRKSLAVTLQLAGRFTRSRVDLGEPTFIANVADVGVRDELRKLYEHDADWNVLLEQSSEEAIGGQISLHQFAEGFVDFPADIPLQNLHPATSTVIYKTKCTEWNPDNFERGIKGLGSVDKIFHSINPHANTLVIVTAKKVPVDWIKVNEVYNWDWELYIVYWNSETKLLFIHSSSNAGYFPTLAQAVAGADVELVQNNDVFRTLSGIKRLLLYNVGLRKQLGRLIRYTMQAGSDVEAGLGETAKRNVTKSNLFGGGYEHGKRTSIGCSRKGRIWSRRIVNIEALIGWFNSVGAKVIDETIDPDEILKGTLKPKIVGSRPAKVPVRIDWPEKFYMETETDFAFTYGTRKVPLHMTDINLKDISDTGNIEFTVKSDNYSTNFSLQLTEVDDVQEYKFARTGGDVVKIYSKGQDIPLEEFFYYNPPVVWFADGSSLEGNTYTELNSEPIAFADSKIEAWNWSGTNIRRESQGVTKDQESIQYKVIQKLIADDSEIVVNDDGSGEAADIVAVRVVETEGGDNYVEIDLYHCKFSSEDTPGARLKDLYEVSGQAQRSSYWRENPSRLFSHLMRRDPMRENGQEVSRFEKGDKNVLQKISRMSEIIESRMNIYIVQPGISKARISEEQKKLLGVTENYLTETYELPFKAIVSE